ncbi:MAG: glycosyltransferase family 4 protein [Alphaproteobacteria bacterium]|nr:glycosyltransferase family 4 protein [Alphaproteobacteria bacterium]
MTKPISICFPYVGDDVGGSHISSLKLIEALDRRRYDPLIVLHENDGRLAPFLRERGHGFIIAPPGVLVGTRRQYANSQLSRWQDAASFMMTSLPKLVRFIRESGIDIVHTNDGRVHLNWGLAARLAGRKHVWHHRGSPSARGVNVLAPILAHQLVTVSAFALPQRPLMPIASKATVIHSPFEHPSPPDRTRAREKLLAELGWPTETRLLGYFGQLISRKRPVAFVEAVAACAQAHPELAIGGLLFGEGAPEEAALITATEQRARDLGVADRIRLMGFKSPIEPYMAGVDVLLVPAVNEPFGRTLIEAMLLGTPVVATNHGGNPEAITDGRNGLLVPAEEPAAFVEPVHRLLTDRDHWVQISETARRQALEKYSVATHVESVCEIYDRLSGNGTAPAWRTAKHLPTNAKPAERIET